MNKQKKTVRASAHADAGAGDIAGFVERFGLPFECVISGGDAHGAIDIRRTDEDTRAPFAVLTFRTQAEADRYAPLFALAPVLASAFCDATIDVFNLSDADLAGNAQAELRQRIVDVFGRSGLGDGSTGDLFVKPARDVPPALLEAFAAATDKARAIAALDYLDELATEWLEQARDWLESGGAGRPQAPESIRRALERVELEIERRKVLAREAEDAADRAGVLS